MDSTRINLAGIAIAALFCAAFILAGIYPYHPKSFTGWLVLYLISLPIVILFEVLQEKLFSVKVASRLGRMARLIYGIVVLGIIMLLSISVVSRLDPYLGKWGS